MIVGESLPKKKKYLYEVDFMRVLFVFGVLSVHTITLYKKLIPAGTWQHSLMNSFHLSLHFTRMGFMFITGLVLFLNYYHKEIHLLPFWKKRYVTVGIPYLFWNAAYLLYDVWQQGSFRWSTFMPNYFWRIVRGDRFYLYYVLVTFQLYLVFPALVALLKKFAPYHRQILAVSFVFQLLITVFIKYWLPDLDTSSWPYLFSHYGVFLLTYQFYFIGGGIVSIHYQEIGQWIDAHGKLLLSAFLVGLVLIWSYYPYNFYYLGLTSKASMSVHQPVVLLYATVVILFVTYLGRSYARHRLEPGYRRLNQFLSLASKLSFGIYLTQSASLTLVAPWVPRLVTNNWLLVFTLPLAIIVVIAISMGISYICFKVPVLAPLIGRRTKKKR